MNWPEEECRGRERERLSCSELQLEETGELLLLIRDDDCWVWFL